MRINHIPKRDLKYHLTFATLTLSSTQIHCDKTIKRECLNHFFIYLKRQTKLKNYLWVSEKQKNGNIHFHILFDRFVHWQILRDIWNKSQDQLGYVERFKLKHGHSNPNSTDIQSLKSIKNPSAYITKYITKESAENCQCGRMWYCSKPLNNLESFVKLVDSKLSTLVDKYNTENPNDTYNSEYFSIIKIRKDGIRKIVGVSIAKEFDKHFIDQYNQLNKTTVPAN